MTARRIALALVLACSLLAVSGAAAPASTNAVPIDPMPSDTTPVAAETAFADSGMDSATNATLTAAYPNPVARGDPGEFVAVRFGTPTDASGWTITDGKTTAKLPNRTLHGEYALSTTPGHAANHTDLPVLELDGRLLLADAGETLELRDEEATVDTARYRRAPESQVRDFEAETWVPVGATELDPVRTAGGQATAFVLPDASRTTAETLEGADDRLYLAGYTLTSERVADALLDAHDRGVEVRVLLDGSPVGGASERQARLLNRLSEIGIDVRLLAGSHKRYRHHHPKYAVVDDRALVLTENFKPAGTGGMSSRGWGAAIDDPEVAEALADLYRADAGWRAATSWETYREGREFQPPSPALETFDTRHPPETVPVESTTILVAPDNAADALVDRIDAAEDRVLIQQVEIDGRDNRLLRAAVRAADRDVAVRIHLSDGWYVEEDNAVLVAWLNRRAEAEGWTLDARVDDADGYGKIHTKGVIVDDAAILGSLNWGTAAKRENREVAVALEGEAVAGYYAGVFEDDWSTDGDRTLPVGVLVGIAVCVAGGLLVARRIEFVGRNGVITEWRS